jgi:hypothetical protein
MGLQQPFILLEALLNCPRNCDNFALMRHVFFIVLGFLAGAVAVFFFIRPDLVNPEHLWQAIQNKLNALYLLQPNQYVVLVFSLLIGLVVLLSLMITIVVWILVLHRKRVSLEDEIFDLRSQLAELLRLKS